MRMQSRINHDKCVKLGLEVFLFLFGVIWGKSYVNILKLSYCRVRIINGS